MKDRSRYTKELPVPKTDNQEMFSGFIFTATIVLFLNKKSQRCHPPPMLSAPIGSAPPTGSATPPQRRRGSVIGRDLPSELHIYRLEQRTFEIMNLFYTFLFINMADRPGNMNPRFSNAIHLSQANYRER